METPEELQALGERYRQAFYVQYALFSDDTDLCDTIWDHTYGEDYEPGCRMLKLLRRMAPDEQKWQHEAYRQAGYHLEMWLLRVNRHGEFAAMKARAESLK